MRKCKARNRKDLLWGAHICGRKHGHKGQHRCYRLSDGKIFIKSRPKPTPCGKRWGKK